MDDLSATGRRYKLLKRFHFDGARPVSGLDLDEQHVSAADADNVPRAKRGGRARAAVSGGFEHGHRAVLGSGSLGFSVHDQLISGVLLGFTGSASNVLMESDSGRVTEIFLPGPI